MGGMPLGVKTIKIIQAKGAHNLWVLFFRQGRFKILQEWQRFWPCLARPSVDLDIVNDTAKMEQYGVAEGVVVQQTFKGRLVVCAVKSSIRRIEGDALINWGA